MSQNKVSIIILNYNQPQLTIDCLKSLSKLEYKNYEVILVDNGSTDNSVEKIKKHGVAVKNFKLVEKKENLGFAEGNNVGFEHTTGKYILFLNNDTLVEKNFLRPLVEKLELDSRLGAVQPKILQYPQKEIIDSVGSYLIATGFLCHFGHNKKDQPKYNKESQIFSMKGACMLFKKEVLDKVGVFDKDYFAYFEETDLCLRTLTTGYKIKYIPESNIFHRGGETSKKMDTAFVNFHSYKNRVYTYLANFQILTILKILPLHILMCEIVSIMYLITLNIPMFLAVQKAMIWNLFNLPKLVKKRAAIKKIRAVRDRQYLPEVMKKVRLSYYYHLFTTSLRGYRD